MLRRRILLSGIAALAAPHVAAAPGDKVLRFVPRFGLTALDPVFTTDQVTRICGMAIFESLYSVDETMVARPQMAEGHTIDQDGKRWSIRLREGLLFHDGEKVLARDCVASMARWMKRDLLARGIAARLDAVEAPDDRTIVVRLKQPFPRLDWALGKPLPNILPIMPARLAATDPAQQVSEIIGSGPFRFLQAEFSAASFAALARFERYHPRSEAPSGTSGGRRALVERVELTTLPDPATAASALMAGEVDWIDTPLPDLLPRLAAHRDVVVGRFDPYGIYTMLRMNHLQGPTASRAIRQAIMAAIDPAEVMQAVVGNDPSLYTAPVGLFIPGSPAANEAGFERLGGNRSQADVKAMLAAAGYNGERLVSLHAIDNLFAHAVSQVVVARLRGVGMTIDDVALDQGTVVQRRNSKEPLDKGGWSFFPQNPSGADHLDPLVALGIRTGAAAWIGWPENRRVEELRSAWIDSDSNDEAGRRRLARELQAEALAEVVYAPLGRYFQPSAWRRGVSGILQAPLPIFWNVRKS